MSQITAAILRDRFLEEQEYIQRYVDFLQYKIEIFESDVREITDILARYDLLEIEEQRDWSLRHKPYSFEELQEVHYQVKKIEPDIKVILEQIDTELEHTEKPKNLGQVDVRSPEGECIQFFLDALEHNLSPQNIEISRKDLLEQIQSSDPDYASAHTSKVVDYAIKSAVYMLTVKKYNELYYAVNRISELDLTLRISRPDAEINIFRQGFITLMTIFDATIFEIVKVALQKDFFNLIPKFGKKDKIPLESFSEFKSFDEFRDEVIEEQLKGKYLKDILFILDDLGVTCTNVADGDKFIHLLETILRRNVHIHNRGRIDEKYLEKNQEGAPKYNIYNFSLGDIAHINFEYWELANRLCRNCVINVSNWADSLS